MNATLETVKTDGPLWEYSNEDAISKLLGLEITETYHESARLFIVGQHSECDHGRPLLACVLCDRGERSPKLRCWCHSPLCRNVHPDEEGF